MQRPSNPGWTTAFTTSSTTRWYPWGSPTRSDRECACAGGHAPGDRLAAVPGSLARHERARHEGKTEGHRHGPGRNGPRTARRDDQGRHREIRRDRQGGQYPVRTGPSKAAAVPLSPFFGGVGEEKVGE